MVYSAHFSQSNQFLMACPKHVLLTGYSGVKRFFSKLFLRSTFQSAAVCQTNITARS